jgi:hypothetical protein
MSKLPGQAGEGKLIGDAIRTNTGIEQDELAARRDAGAAKLLEQLKLDFPLLWERGVIYTTGPGGAGRKKRSSPSPERGCTLVSLKCFIFNC